MPPAAALQGTIAEREAELAALQAAFDEYISSSRELEEELDAELAKMQEKLAESSSANAALSSQLENIAPQLASLEKSLSETRAKLELEQKLRRQSEAVQDEAEARARELEGALQSLHEDCDAAHEQLAFKESELEETKLELEVERERYRVEVEELQQDLEVATSALQQQEEQMQKNSGGTATENGTSTPSDAADDDFLQSATSTAAADGGKRNKGDETFVDHHGFPMGGARPEDDDYVKRLEDELELVTEQLIDTEQRLTQAEEALAEERAKHEGEGGEGADAAVVSTSSSEGGAGSNEAEMKQALGKLQEEHEALQEEFQKLREEYELAQEELTLTQEELKAAEDDVSHFEGRMESARVEHRNEVSKLRTQLETAQSEQRQSAASLTAVEETLQKTTTECETLKVQNDNFNSALENAKKDRATLEAELEAVNVRFDEVRAEAERVGRESGAKEAHATISSQQTEQTKKYKDRIHELEETNVILQHSIDEAEMEIAALRDSSEEKKATESAHSEVVKRLQEQLMRVKDELGKKEKDVDELKNALESRVGQAEDQISRLEKELSSTKGQLAEAEAHLIVSRREKARSSILDPSASTTNSNSMSRINSQQQQTHADREDLKEFDLDAAPRRSLAAGSRRRTRSTSPTSTMRLERRAEEEVGKANKMQEEVESLKAQYRMEEARVKRLEDDLKTLQTQLFATNGDAHVVTQMSRISAMGTSPRSTSGDGVDMEQDLLGGPSSSVSKMDEALESGDMALIGKEVKALEEKVSRQREYNAQLLSKILALQGNIQVCCRVRPISMKEIQAGHSSAVESLSETEIGCYDQRTNKWKSFAFDKVWGPDQSQPIIFQDVEPLALSVVDGYNACIFAYGQTGSGKTYTMEGTEVGGNYGISYRTIQKIFHLLNLRYQQQKAVSNLEGLPDANFYFNIELGMLEIYNDEVYDLLNGEKGHAGGGHGMKRLDIRKGQDGRVEVPGLTKEPVKSIKDVMVLLKMGNTNRATASTDLNEHSSRSHMVLAVDVRSGMEGHPENKGTLYLVDLAGSERVRKSKVEGEQLKEAGFINKSLSALGNVMEALDRKASHVPYRDSKLTYLLQDSLGGNSRTMMVVTVCPIETAVDESVHALQFATRVRRIQIGAAQRNVTAKNLEETVKALTAEMKQLTVAKEKSEYQLNSLKRDNARIQERLQTLSQMRSKSQAENKTLEVLRKNNQEMANRWQKEKSEREKTSEELEKSKVELRKKQTEVTKLARDMEKLKTTLEEKETLLDQSTKELRRAKDASSAANLRARKAQIISSRNSRASPKNGSSNQDENDGGPTSPTKVPKTPPPSESQVAKIREEVLALLTKYDTAKVDRIDVIMEKFKGKEHLLVQKMKQRYEGGGGGGVAADATAAPPASAVPEGDSTGAVSLQKRSELALQRHKERMKNRQQQPGAK